MVDRGAGCTSSNERHMLVISGTQPGELFCDARAVREELGRFEHGAKLTTDASNSTGHTELAHVRLDSLHMVICKKLLDHIECPTRGAPRVLAE